MTTGIDVSKHQANINWQLVKLSKAPEVSFAYIKASEGVGYVDPQMKINADGVKATGIDFGFYHFASLNNKIDIVSDAKSEAQFFAKTINNFPTATMPPVLDIESNKSGLSRDQVLLWVKTFIAEITFLGHADIVLYSYTPFLNDNLPATHGLGNVPLWIAAYTKTLKLPNGWTKAWLWQYTDAGKINGIKTNVDLNKTL